MIEPSEQPRAKKGCGLILSAPVENKGLGQVGEVTQEQISMSSYFLLILCIWVSHSSSMERQRRFLTHFLPFQNYGEKFFTFKVSL